VAARFSSVRSASGTFPAGPTAWTGARTAAARACPPCWGRSSAVRAVTPRERATSRPCDTIVREPWRPVTGGEPPGQGRLAQRKSVSLTRRRSGVRAPQRPLVKKLGRGSSPHVDRRTMTTSPGNRRESFSLPPGRYGTKSLSPSPPFGRTNYDADDIWRLGVSP
jgi:hypothetical protein